MSLTLPAGHHVLRLTALTPANCGDTGGSAAVDRPVALDAWSLLPYLPYSALKGVLAGRRGNVHLRGGALNLHRTELFGAPAPDDQGLGKKSAIIFGDADTLAFPLLLRDGRRALVVAASTLWQLARHGIIPSRNLLHVEGDFAYEGPVARSELPPLPEPLRTARFGIDLQTLAELLGPYSGPVIIAASGAASALWQAAVEERTLTALGNGRTVREGSLRTVELIPAGTIFVSLVSNLTGELVDLGESAPIQLGAWESAGFGYFSAAFLTALAERQQSTSTSLMVESPAEPRPRIEVMRDVFLAMSELQSRPEAARARSAIFDLGSRFARHGLAVTLAFCLAKAGGGEDAGESEDRVHRERAAYRWLLRQLFGAEQEAPHAELYKRVVNAIGKGAPALPADFYETRLWLRRYAETLLPKEKASD